MYRKRCIGKTQMFDPAEITQRKSVLYIFLILLMFQGVLSAQILPKNQLFTLPGGESAAGNKTRMPGLKDIASQDIDASADSYEYIGSNLVARGHVVIRNKSMQITGNNAIINLKTGDAEVAGNVEFRAETCLVQTMDLTEYKHLLKDPALKVRLLRQVTTPAGRKKFKVEVRKNTAYIKAERLSGNMNTGAFQFRKFSMKGEMLFVSGDLAERYADGSIKIFKAKSSTCEYLLDSKAHYAIGAKEMLLTPREANRSLFHSEGDHGDYSILAKNSFLYLWNVPVFWFPALYKPRDFSTFGGRLETGKDSDWGWFIRVRKEVDILEKPARVRGGVLLDYYDDRGFGYGAMLDITTPESSTELFAYSLRDRNPYTLWEDDFGENPKVDSRGAPMTDEEWITLNSRMKIPKNRYEFRLSNLTYFNPRLSFRGQVDMLSDYNFLEEYFEARYNKDVQPPSFAALDYQGDSFSGIVQSTFKVNSFDVTVERLPEVRFDIFRKELFEGVYYQSQTSGGYYKMNWREFDRKRWENPRLTPETLASAAKYPGKSREIIDAFKQGTLTKEQAIRALWASDRKAYDPYLDELKNYESARFDTLHAFYYPMRFLDGINFIPRFAARLTAYSRSSKGKVDLDAIYNMVNANDLDRWPSGSLFVKNYDKDGEAEYRFALELGAELNTKFYRTWQTPKSAFFQIDGLRHVFVPYINYTFIPKPTVDYTHIYYFDDVDQITRQNFFRIGMVNRLQTRGENSQVRQYFSMENYWDYHFHRDFGFNNLGDFTTLLSFTPTEEFTFATKLVLDVGNNNEHDYQVKRGGKDAGRPGISSNLFNRWETSLTYKFSKDWQVSASYLYSDNYYQRATYSMASTLASAAAMTSFSTYFDRQQMVYLSLAFPTLIDDRLKGRASISYDVDDDIIDNVDLTLTRHFHCWYLQVSAGAEFSRNAVDHRTWDGYIGFALGLSAMPGAAITAKHEE